MSSESQKAVKDGRVREFMVIVSSLGFVLMDAKVIFDKIHSSF
jgi:hypothetical protein